MAHLGGCWGPHSPLSVFCLAVTLLERVIRLQSATCLLCNVFLAMLIKSSDWPSPILWSCGDRERKNSLSRFSSVILVSTFPGHFHKEKRRCVVSVFKISVDTQTLTIFSGANGRRGRDIIDRRYLANITLTNTDTQHPDQPDTTRSRLIPGNTTANLITNITSRVHQVALIISNTDWHT